VFAAHVTASWVCASSAGRTIGSDPSNIFN
jgi:hypothetical protein